MIDTLTSTPFFGLGVTLLCWYLAVRFQKRTGLLICLSLIHIWSSVALGSPQSRFSRMVPENRVFFCSTTLTDSRKCSMV